MTILSTDRPYPDPSVYRIGSGAFRTMIDAIYDRLGAYSGHEVRRVIISLSCGLFIFLVGLLIAAPINFVSEYVSTAGVYVVAITAAIGFDQIRLMKQRYFACLNET